MVQSRKFTYKNDIVIIFKFFYSSSCERTFIMHLYAILKLDNLVRLDVEKTKFTFVITSEELERNKAKQK